MLWALKPTPSLLSSPISLFFISSLKKTPVLGCVVCLILFQNQNSPDNPNLAGNSLSVSRTLKSFSDLTLRCHSSTTIERKKPFFLIYLFSSWALNPTLSSSLSKNTCVVLCCLSGLSQNLNSPDDPNLVGNSLFVGWILKPFYHLTPVFTPQQQLILGWHFKTWIKGVFLLPPNFLMTFPFVQRYLSNSTPLPHFSFVNFYTMILTIWWSSVLNSEIILLLHFFFGVVLEENICSFFLSSYLINL